MIKLFSILRKSFLHFIFPSKCFHCAALLSPDFTVLCEECSPLMELIEPEGRCPICFHLESSLFSSHCEQCLHERSLYTSMGAAFHYKGPPASLIKRLKYGNSPFLAKGLAAFLVAQLERLQWPLPDAIIPVPLSFSRWLERGYNQSHLLADEMGKFIERPVWNVLKRYSGDYSQAELSLEQRKALSGKSFRLKSKHDLKNKVLLVVDDVMTSGSTLSCCAELLDKENPHSLYALTACKS